MSRKVEYISPAGLRQDGRRGFEHRKATCELGTLENCDGSAVLTVGGTTVHARVQGPREVGRTVDVTLADKVVITCDVAITAFAGERRKHAASTAGSRQSDDIQRAVQSTVQSLVLTSQYPASNIHLRVDVIHHDGSEKAAAINAACLALVDACIAVRGLVLATTVGVLDAHLVCDLTALELRSQCPVATVAFLVTAAGASSNKLNASAAACPNVTFVELNSRISETTLDDMMDEAARCAQALYSTLAPQLRHHAQEARTAIHQATYKR
jgi:exosome complex component RRP41